MKTYQLVLPVLLVSVSIYISEALTSTGDNCIRDCKGQKNGFYQSCNSCKEYIQCKRKKVKNTLQCGKRTKWNDDAKKCTRKGSDCKLVDLPDATTLPLTTTTEAPTTGPRCITDCKGKSRGQFQLCHTCSEYVKCKRGKVLDELSCGTKEWDDKKKKCVKNSGTCTPIPGPAACEGCNGKPCDENGKCECRECPCANFYTNPTCTWEPCHGRSGNYPHFDDCTKYVECYRSTHVADHQCPPNTAFHIWNLNCTNLEDFGFITCHLP